MGLHQKGLSFVKSLDVVGPLTQEAELVGVLLIGADAVPGVNAPTSCWTTRMGDTVVAGVPGVPLPTETLVRLGAVPMVHVATCNARKKN